MKVILLLILEMILSIRGLSRIEGITIKIELDVLGKHGWNIGHHSRYI
jgi:hypothetical protein